MKKNLDSDLNQLVMLSKTQFWKSKLKQGNLKPYLAM